MMARPSGIDEANIFHIASESFAKDYNERVIIEEDLAALRALPGVVDVVQTNSVPLSQGGWSMGLQTEPGPEIDGTGVAIYFVDEHALGTLDLTLLSGENFSPTDIGWRQRSDTEWPAKGLVTRAMVEALYPDDPDSALGQTVYINDDEPLTITGIIDQMQAPWNGWSGVERVMLVPQHTLFGFTRYVVRAEPGRRDELMPQVEELLAGREKGRIVHSMETMEQTRLDSYRSDDSMIKMLTFVVTLLVVITSLGIVGLASFSVNRRTKQIGTRRALGAPKAAILKYFMTENLLISLVGVTLGGALAVGLNMWMVELFALTRVAWYLVPVSMVLLCIVGQVAVLGPARKAASVSPAVATRTV